MTYHGFCMMVVVLFVVGVWAKSLRNRQHMASKGGGSKAECQRVVMELDMEQEVEVLKRDLMVVKVALATLIMGLTFAVVVYVLVKSNG